MFMCRGKTKADGFWVIGQAVQMDEKWYILISENLFAERPAYNALAVGSKVHSQKITDPLKAAALGWTEALDVYEKQFPAWVEIEPGTIGRSANIADKAGVVIFDGDIITAKVGTPPFLPRYVVHPNAVTGIISFKDENWKLKPIKDTIGIMKEFNVNVKGFLRCDLRVIGNIHDNPELLPSADRGGLQHADQPTLYPGA